jgi:hypothetical protein
MAALLGGIIGGGGMLIIPKFIKGKLSSTPTFMIIRNDIEKVVSTQSMGTIWVFNIHAKDGNVYSFHTKEHEKWQELLEVKTDKKKKTKARN